MPVLGEPQWFYCTSWPDEPELVPEVWSGSSRGKWVLPHSGPPHAWAAIKMPLDPFTFGGAFSHCTPVMFPVDSNVITVFTRVKTHHPPPPSRTGTVDF